MIQMSIAEMAQIMGGRANGDIELSNQAQFHFDSREVRAGDIFLALKGERADGHDYVADAISSGAALSIVTQAVSSPHILVGDVLAAIAKLASYVRGELKGLKVVGITGSQGKTTTKDLLFSILSN